MNDLKRAENCDALARDLLTVDEDEFFMMSYGLSSAVNRKSLRKNGKFSCGTSACAAGWAGTLRTVPGFCLELDESGVTVPTWKGEEYVEGVSSLDWVFGLRAEAIMRSGTIPSESGFECLDTRTVSAALEECARQLREEATV